MSDNRNVSFSKWIFDSFELSAEGAALYRIFYGLFLLFFLLPSLDLYPFISSLPGDFFMPPPGPMALFNNFPSYNFFLILHGALFLSTCCLIAGFYTRLSSIFTGIFLLLIKGFIFSVGKINHELLFILIPFLMAFSGWGKVYSIDAARGKKTTVKIEHWTLLLLALFIGFMFFTAGFSKIIGGWLNIDTHAALGHFYKQYFVVGRQDFLADNAIQISSPVFWESMDYLTVLFETSFLLAVFHARSARIYICMAVLFHFSLMMILNISFLPNFAAYAAFLNWNNVARYLNRFFTDQQTKWLAPFLFGFLLSGFFTGILLMENNMLLEADWGMPGFIIVTCSVPIALYHLVRQVQLPGQQN